MQETEGKRGNQRATNKAETPSEMHFPLSQVQAHKMMHSQSPVHNKFKNQTPLYSITSLPKTFSPLLAHAHIKLPLKLRLPLNRCYAMNAMQEV